MSIITISRGSYTRGTEVAQKVAEKLGYECISRDDIIEEASDEFNVSAVKLIRAIHDAPSILDRFTYGKERFVAYFEPAFLEHLQKDNIVYHGLAGHFFLKGVSHVLKVRIIADMEERVRVEMEREGSTRKEALRILKKDDEERRNWSRHLYGIDTHDPSLYDLVIHVKTLTVDDVADLICYAVKLKHFQTTPESTQRINDLLLAARVKAALIDMIPDIEVSAQDGVAHVKATAVPLSQQEKLLREIRKALQAIPDLKDIEVNIFDVGSVPT